MKGNKIRKYEKYMVEEYKSKKYKWGGYEIIEYKKIIILLAALVLSFNFLQIMRADDAAPSENAISTDDATQTEAQTETDDAIPTTDNTQTEDASQAQANDALAIIKKADSAFIAHKIYSISEMTVYRSGKARPTMEVETYTMDKNTTDYSLSIYKKPAKMKGTAYLMIGDSLWVKFASTGRTRKLSSSAKKNSAGGTDFSYNDMGESSKGISYKYDVSLENRNRNVIVDGEKCYKISLIPKPGMEAPYEKLVAYIAKKNYQYIKIDYFEMGANIKTLYFYDYRKVEGRDYPFKMVMQSHTKPSRTEVITSKVEFNSPKVKDRYFSVSYLEKIK